jgi:hypothetical protein
MNKLFSDLHTVESGCFWFSRIPGLRLVPGEAKGSAIRGFKAPDIASGTVSFSFPGIYRLKTHGRIIFGRPGRNKHFFSNSQIGKLDLEASELVIARGHDRSAGRVLS